MDFLGESLAGDTLEVEVAAERVGNSSIVIGFTMQNLRTEEVAGKAASPTSLWIKPREELSHAG